MNLNFLSTNAIKPGKVIIASPLMDEPVYKNCVVLIVNVTEKGTTGIILNQEYTVNNVFQNLAVKENLLYGGPIQSNIITFLHNYPEFPAARKLGKNLSWSSDSESIPRILHLKNDSANRIRFYAGLTGWRNHELESELKNNFWWVADISPEEIFSINSDFLYPYLIRRNSLSLDDANEISGHYLN